MGHENHHKSVSARRILCVSFIFNLPVVKNETHKKCKQIRTENEINVDVHSPPLALSLCECLYSLCVYSQPARWFFFFFFFVLNYTLNVRIMRNDVPYIRSMYSTHCTLIERAAVGESRFAHTNIVRVFFFRWLFFRCPFKLPILVYGCVIPLFIPFHLSVFLCCYLEYSKIDLNELFFDEVYELLTRERFSFSFSPLWFLFSLKNSTYLSAKWMWKSDTCCYTFWLLLLHQMTLS